MSEERKLKLSVDYEIRRGKTYLKIQQDIHTPEDADSMSLIIGDADDEIDILLNDEMAEKLSTLICRFLGRSLNP